MFTRVARTLTRGWILAALIIVAILVSAILPLSMAKHSPHEDGSARPSLDLGNMRLSFEPNVGQASAPSNFLARAPGSTIYFSPSGMAIEVQSAAASQVAS